MLLKLLWIVVVAWIVYRVWLAGRNLFRIAMGHEGTPIDDGRQGSARSTDGTPRAPATARDDRVRRPEVEDARWVDL